MTDLIKHDPFRNLLTRPQWLEDFEDFFSASATQRGLRIHETDKNILVEAVVAGVAAKDVDVEIEDGILAIKAENKTEEKNKNSYQSASYRYYYTAALSGGEWNKSEAEIKDGVVRISIPKTEAARPRKINVKTT